MKFSGKGVAAGVATLAAIGALLGAADGSANAATASVNTPAATCPTSGAACFYGETNFNDDFGVYYPNTGYADAYGTIGLRNRTGYWLCLVNEDNGASYVQAPNSQTANIGGGWNGVDALVYFHPNSNCFS